ncbi:hypothetical protein PGLA_13660 [Paenibacillus glacialis]|uniref:Uncharacterized protein n=1 Tax=Paenibacillus glacialis TaxID=494026 RepID=A0A168KJP1_9BACL|nr:hypothetical protein PGLA_13660 [Paenibacillus glacialis]
MVLLKKEHLQLKKKEKISEEFDRGHNVIIDKRELIPEHVNLLKEAIKEAGISDQIIWYPEWERTNDSI